MKISKQILGQLSSPGGHQAYFDDGRAVTPHNVTTYEWWPGCTGDPGTSLTSDANFSNCGTVCCNCQMVPSFRTLNSQSDYMAVEFMSRKGPDGQDDVKLTGWWLPAPGVAAGGPVVVVQHGMGGTINSARPSMAAFLLRSSGFSVFTGNLRDHGTSGQSSHKKQSWGWDYPLDTLGAWDYVVNDPDGVLGGPRDPSKVGLMGMSLGGFVSSIAFGVEHRAPALWLDGAVFDPQDLMVAKSPLGAFTKILLPLSWWIVDQMVGVDMRHNLPSTALATGPSTKRPVMIVQSKDDSSVPWSMAEDFVKILAEGDRYAVSKEFDWGGKCGNDDHNMLFWIEPEAYRRSLCTFWSRALLKQECDMPAANF